MLISFSLADSCLAGYIKLVTLMTGYKKDGDLLIWLLVYSSLALRKFAFRRLTSPFQNHYQYSVVTFRPCNTHFSRHSRSLWEKARVGWSERIASKYVYYQLWKRSPVQVGCMRQVLRVGELGWPRRMGWGGRWEGGSGWGTHVNPWLIHVYV